MIPFRRKSPQLLALLQVTCIVTFSAAFLPHQQQAGWTNLQQSPSWALSSSSTTGIPKAAPRPSRRPSLAWVPTTSSASTTTTTSLYAKKKANAKLAALEALEALEEKEATLDLDQPMSKKEMKELEKKRQKEQKQQQKSADPAAATKPKDAKAAALAALEALEEEDGSDLDKPLSKKEQRALMKKGQQQEEEEPNGVNGSAVNGSAVNGGDSADSPSKPMSKKEQMLMKALEMEELDNASASDYVADEPKLSKKELKALQKKEEKMAAKEAAKAAKKAERAAEMAASEDGLSDGDDEDTVNGVEFDAEPPMDDDDDEAADYDFDPDDPDAPAKAPRQSLEDKIRKERPPPRIRVMESSQPGYTSLRLENIGITFRNQQVLKDVTWGVQTGDRIGLVGANGAGKTTQLRIMANEMEPTTGDLVKSSQDLRVAMLRQEFVDELVKDRTLKEEFMSVFEEELKILQDLKDAEKKLETMDAENDVDEMQEVLDLMQDLQNKAESKGVYALESKVKKVMDVMGFNDDEGEDLVASFSGGWKMRIGLGKVLLKDPNILLLGKCSSFSGINIVDFISYSSVMAWLPHGLFFF